MGLNVDVDRGNVPYMRQMAKIILLPALLFVACIGKPLDTSLDPLSGNTHRYATHSVLPDFGGI